MGEGYASCGGVENSRTQSQLRVALSKNLLRGISFSPSARSGRGRERESEGDAEFRSREGIFHLARIIYTHALWLYRPEFPRMFHAGISVPRPHLSENETACPGVSAERRATQPLRDSEMALRGLARSLIGFVLDFLTAVVWRERRDAPVETS